jgi:hypothetical protein
MTNNNARTIFFQVFIRTSMDLKLSVLTHLFLILRRMSEAYLPLFYQIKQRQLRIFYVALLE